MDFLMFDSISIHDQNNTIAYGEALTNYGLVVRDAVNGWGLVTRGFLWQAYDIWIKIEDYDAVTTSWSDSDAVISTSWSDSNASITTVWTDSSMSEAPGKF